MGPERVRISNCSYYSGPIVAAMSLNDVSDSCDTIICGLETLGAGALGPYELWHVTCSSCH